MGGCECIGGWPGVVVYFPPKCTVVHSNGDFCLFSIVFQCWEGKNSKTLNKYTRNLIDGILKSWGFGELKNGAKGEKKHSCEVIPARFCSLHWIQNYAHKCVYVHESGVWTRRMSVFMSPAQNVKWCKECLCVSGCWILGLEFLHSHGPQVILNDGVQR